VSDQPQPASEQAFVVTDAWKFTGRHGSAQVDVGALDAGGELAFYGRDDGAGFDEQHAQHLFGLFQRMHLRGEFPGDGVGLATVQRHVRKHGGHAWAEAAVENGATFCFTLPGAHVLG
jgi:light-regulated signal transduction histidine kinase (bacteriophytochrome)